MTTTTVFNAEAFIDTADRIERHARAEAADLRARADRGLLRAVGEIIVRALPGAEWITLYQPDHIKPIAAFGADWNFIYSFTEVPGSNDSEADFLYTVGELLSAVEDLGAYQFEVPEIGADLAISVRSLLNA